MFLAPHAGLVALALALPWVGPRAPAEDSSKLVGSWSWSYKDAQSVEHKHVLEVESAKGKLSAQEKRDGDEPVKVTDLKIDGKTVTFSVMRDKVRTAYRGSLDSDDTINGMVTVTVDNQPNEFGWTAKKEAVKTK